MKWEYSTLIINYQPKNSDYNWEISYDGKRYAAKSMSTLLDIQGNNDWEIINIFPDRWLTNDDGDSFVVSYMVISKRPQTEPLDLNGEDPLLMEVVEDPENKN